MRLVFDGSRIYQSGKKMVASLSFSASSFSETQRRRQHWKEGDRMPAHVPTDTCVGGLVQGNGRFFDRKSPHSDHATRCCHRATDLAKTLSTSYKQPANRGDSGSSVAGPAVTSGCKSPENQQSNPTSDPRSQLGRPLNGENHTCVALFGLLSAPAHTWTRCPVRSQTSRALLHLAAEGRFPAGRRF